MVGFKPTVCLSDLVRDIKTNTTLFINENQFTPFKFAWQEGFGAFSYAHSQIDSVCKYILNQEEHHRARSFEAVCLVTAPCFVRKTKA
jgi:putative transposase